MCVVCVFLGRVELSGIELGTLLLSPWLFSGSFLV